VQRSQGLAEVQKMEKLSIIKEETGGIISRRFGRRNFRRFAGANKDIHEVTKRDFKSRSLDLEGHVEKD
jgi:hypothetical protein